LDTTNDIGRYRANQRLL